MASVTLASPQASLLPTASRSSVAGRTRAARPLAPAETEVWRQTVRRDWRQLERVPAPLKSDRRIVMEAQQQDWRAMHHAADELRNDRELVLEVVRMDGRALASVAEVFRYDREVLVEAVNRCGMTLSLLDPQLADGMRLRRDREVVLSAVRQDWRAVEYADEQFLADREVGGEAIRGSWEAIQFLSEELRADRALLEAAIAQSGEALRFAPEELRADPALRAAASAAGWGVVAEGEARMVHCDPAKPPLVISPQSSGQAYVLQGLIP